MAVKELGAMKGCNGAETADSFGLKRLVALKTHGWVTVMDCVLVSGLTAWLDGLGGRSSCNQSERAASFSRQRTEQYETPKAHSGTLRAASQMYNIIKRA